LRFFRIRIRTYASASIKIDLRFCQKDRAIAVS
jgi:hypothetical protein